MAKSGKSTPRPSFGKPEDWIAVFKATHGGQTPEQYNAQVTATQKWNAGPGAAKPVPAFLTPEQEIEKGAFITSIQGALAQLDQTLGQAEIDTPYQKGQVEKQAQDASGATNWDSAARGLFQSSIRDASLDDIAKQKTVNQKLLDDRLDSLRTATVTQKGLLQSQLADATKPGGHWESIAAGNAKVAQDAITQSMPAPPAPIQSAAQAGLVKPQPAAPPRVANPGGSPQQTTGARPPAIEIANPGGTAQPGTRTRNGRTYRQQVGPAGSPERWVAVR